jgi:hypothetical protein
VITSANDWFRLRPEPDLRTAGGDTSITDTRALMRQPAPSA